MARKLCNQDKKRETAWYISLVHHLLKELSLNQQYRLDMFSKFKNDTCSCCGEPIGEYGRYDDCSLGKLNIWQGGKNKTCSYLNLVEMCSDIESDVIVKYSAKKRGF